MEEQASILIIDDDYELASVLQTILNNQGYKTLVAHSAAQVASLLAQDNEHASWPVSLILLDLMMPQVDGGELYGWLRAHPKTSTTPIIVLSAVGSISRRVELLSKGVDDYIVKPCPVEELLARVSIHIRLHELRQAKQEAEVRSDLQTNLLNAIDEVGKTMRADERDLTTMLTKTIQTVVEQFAAVNCALYLNDLDTGDLQIVTNYPAEFTPPSSYVPFLKRITLQKEVVSSGLTLGLPLMADGELIGAVVTQVKDPNDIHGDFRQSLAIVIRQISLMVAYFHLMEQQQQSSDQLQAALANGQGKTQLSREHYDPLQTVYSYLQLLTEFEMDREKQVSYLKMARSEIAKLLEKTN